jgi:hypothetical protein
MITPTAMVWLQPQVSCVCNFYKIFSIDLLNNNDCNCWYGVIATTKEKKKSIDAEVVMLSNCNNKNKPITT